MKYDFTDFTIIASGETEKDVAKIFANEVSARCGKRPMTAEKSDGKTVELAIEDAGECETFKIVHDGEKIKITAHRMRSLIYGFGMFLRKAEISDGRITLVKNISGEYTPAMPIRGHQLGYSATNNTYDAWTKEQYRQYIIDLMLFGTNIIEGDAGKDEGVRNRLMHYTYKEAVLMKAEICDELDIDYSIWHPLSTSLTDDETVEEAVEKYGGMCKLNVLFPPGGDPGELEAEAFVERCKKLKRSLVKYFPDIKMYPSAQAPHCYPDWGDRFVKKMAELPEEIDGVVFGPNHAMPIDELRRRIDSRYPFRLYPDLSHNVRCEVPVHFQRDDWHFAYAATLSRESVNPRPTEFREYHRLTRPYVNGSVSYSEGCHDDLNKFVFGAMDFDPDCDLRESVLDYARAFYVGADAEKIADGIFALEQNWEGDPAENSSVDTAYEIFTLARDKNPQLMENWRFVLHLFRAYCDKLVRDRRLFELELIDDAELYIRSGDIENAKKILASDFDDTYKKMRAELNDMAVRLHKQIGIQLDVENFCGRSWDRGCTLDTIDNPVTDRRWLLDRLEKFPERAAEFIDRNKVERDEYYFSFALHGFDVCGSQEGEFYMDFRGDSNFNAALPMCMTKVYDHFNFKTKAAGLKGGDYLLRITYKNRPNDEIIHHRITVNGNVIHDGKQFGGVRDEEYEKLFLADGYVSIVYDIPQSVLVNGCAELEITEPLDGFMISEFRFTKNNQK